MYGINITKISIIIVIELNSNTVVHCKTVQVIIIQINQSFRTI